MEPIRFHIVTLGCSKNQVDSEGMAQLLAEQGLVPAEQPDDAQVLIVNTCGFLASARRESAQAIQELLEARRSGQVVIAAGCMAALDDHRAEIPAGVDAILSTREWPQIGQVIGRLLDLPMAPVRPDGQSSMLASFHRARATGPSAYVKIADGCDHACSFCAIPLIKGGQASKRPSEIVREIRELVDGGVKEVVLVSQDTIRYGADLGVKHGLPGLVRLIAEQVPALHWLRMLYIYPSPLVFRLIDAMAETSTCVPYLDMPIQHADPDILRAMARPSNVDLYRRIFSYAREKLDGAVLRTTLIVGFPGETDEQFRRLYDFVAEIEFDHVGVFAYSREAPTASAKLSGAVPPEVAEERRAALLELQQRISLRKNRALVGQTLEVLIEGVGELEDEAGDREPISVGRAARHAPEVDGLVFIPGAQPVGALVQARVVDAGPYDLWANPVAPSAAAPGRRPSPAARPRAVNRRGRRAAPAPGARARRAGR